jgi:hypothetical protein
MLESFTTISFNQVNVEEIELTSPDKTGSYSNGKAGLFHPARQSDLGHKHSTYFAQLIGITVIKL